MGEPEDHTLVLLWEIRDDIQRVERRIDSLGRKVDQNHAELKIGTDALMQTLAGEMATRAYGAGAIERRLSEIERRLADLEKTH
jgi:hypothetical protein